MKRGILLGLVVFLVLFSSPVFAGEQKTCAVYFTKIGCPNCAITDPMVLSNWPSRNDDLVVIEYMFWNWGEENARLLGQYSQKYGTMSSVPQLFISSKKTGLGSLEIPQMEDDLEDLKGNPCLVDGSLSFEEVDLNSIPGNPLKLWTKGRLLVRTGDQEVSNEFLKELLFSENLTPIIDESDYKIVSVEAEPAPISEGEIDFERALEIEDSWTLKVNEDVTVPDKGEGGDENVMQIPLLGEMDITQVSLPVLTVLIGGADGFNPCAFFILTFLLSAMLLAKSRKRILIVGGIFVFFSALIYFLFMCAWLNIFLIGAEMKLLTLLAGLVAIAAGLINVKDYFFFKKGPSLTLPTQEKHRFFDKAKGLMKAKSLWALALGTVILAVTVNMYELLCTVGFPMVYIRVLTLRNLPALEYYLYLVFYNIVYVLPLTVIVILFAATLGSKKFTVESVKKLKLVSGLIILMLGGVLIFSPEMLENVATTFMILVVAVIISGIVFLVRRLWEKEKE